LEIEIDSGVHWGLKHEQLASPLKIEIKTVGVPQADPLGIET